MKYCPLWSISMQTTDKKKEKEQDRVKPERMDYLEKGADIGVSIGIRKSKEGKKIEDKKPCIGEECGMYRLCNPFAFEEKEKTKEEEQELKVFGEKDIKTN